MMTACRGRGCADWVKTVRVAQQKQVVVTDVDGTEGARTCHFVRQDASYESDLTDEYRDELQRVLVPYIDAGPRVRAGRQRDSWRRRRSSSRTGLGAGERV